MKIREKTNENVYVSSEQVIDRSAWVCGNGEADLDHLVGSTLMLNEEGFMCCLGHVCHNSGFGKDLLLSEGLPEDVVADTDFLDLPYLVDAESEDEDIGDSAFAGQAVSINDDRLLAPKEREKQLKVLFKEHGITLKFVGRYPAKVRAYHKEQFGE